MNPIFQDALNDYRLAIVGRVRTALLKPEMETLPASCTTYKPRFVTHHDIQRLINFVSKALRTGAGVNIHLDYFKEGTSNPACEITFKDNPSLKDCPFSYKVSDSMERLSRRWNPWLVKTEEAEGQFWPSIELAVFYAYRTASRGISVNFDLSNIRPAGVKNEQGMVSSGPDSFANLLRAAFDYGRFQNLDSLMSFLSAFNQELRRGGTYKNGALTTSMPCCSSQALNYLQIDKAKHPWLKKGFVLTEDFLSNSVFNDQIGLVLTGVNNGTLWLEKAVVQDEDHNYVFLHSNDARLSKRLLSNVCREVFLESRATCDLTHVNAGQCLTPHNLIEAFTKGMQFLCELKKLGLTQKAGIYKLPSQDRQVGLGVLGLANQLAILGITFADFNHALERLLDSNEPVHCPEELNEHLLFKNADELALSYQMAYFSACKVALEYGMQRAFVIAPTANSSFRHQDIMGYTTSPEISPPIDIQTERVSETVEDPEIFYYNPDSETASEVGWHTYSLLVENWQKLMQSTGLAHSISWNIWVDFDFQALSWFLQSELKTTYYRLNVEVGYFDKSNPTQQITCDCTG